MKNVNIIMEKEVKPVTKKLKDVCLSVPFTGTLVYPPHPTHFTGLFIKYGVYVINLEGNYNSFFTLDGEVQNYKEVSLDITVKAL